MRAVPRWLVAAVGLAAGCAPLRYQGLVPADLSVPAAEARVLPPPAPPTPEEVPLVREPVAAAEEFDLPGAVAFALENNPRLRVLAGQADAARAGEQVAFAPLLPQVDFTSRLSAFNDRVLPAAGFVAGTLTGGNFSFAVEELGLYWTLYDFGRTPGRYGQAVTLTEIAVLQLERAKQSVAFDVASAYLRLLASGAERRVRQQAVSDAEAVLRDTRARRSGGVAERESVLRAEVEASAAREALVVARQREAGAAATLNAAMGRGVSLPVRARDLPAPPAAAAESLEEALRRAVARRREIEVARRAVAGAAYGEQAARGELLPKIYLKATVVRFDAPDVKGGYTDGIGIHLDQPLYGGGRRIGERRRSAAEVQTAVARGQVVLDQVALEVNLAWQAIASARERVTLGEVTVARARENLRLQTVRYRNGDATPTDIVDAQTALTAAQTRYNTAVYDDFAARAALEFATGGDPAAIAAAAPPAPRP
jgi:outer membrane protein